MLPYKERIHKEDFLRIIKKGKRINTTNFSLIFLKTLENKRFFAVVISKKVHPKAHDRNSLKRKIHDLLNKSKEKLPFGYFILFPKGDLSGKKEIFIDEIVKNFN